MRLAGPLQFLSLLVRLRRDQLLALAVALFLIVDPAAKTTAGAPWLVAALWAAMAAFAMLAATWMVPRFVWFKRMATQLGQPRW